MINNQAPARALAIITAILLLSACTSAPEKPATMTALPACGWLPNCVNSGPVNSSRELAPLAANESKWHALKAWLAQQPHWTIVRDDGDFMQLTVTTPTIGFVDDVQLLFIPQNQVLQVRSSSRLGIGDLGTNAKRVEMLRRRLH